MLKKIIISFKNINHKLFVSLLVMGLVPTVYTTLRVFWLGELPGEWSYSIAGQLSWVNLIYEVINEAIILPLYYFVGKVLSDKKELTNRLKTGLTLTSGIYLVLSVFIVTFAEALLKLMATDPSIIDASAMYIRIEAIANIFAVLSQFALVGLVTLGKDKLVYLLTGAKLIICIILDLFLVSSLSFSANFGVNGIGFSNIAVNFIIFGITLFLLARNGANVFNKEKFDFGWVRGYFKIGGISGLESLVRNLAYMVMIARKNIASLSKTFQL